MERRALQEHAAAGALVIGEPGSGKTRLLAEVLAAATWKLETRGGHGAFRELVERLLRERGQWDALVQDFVIGRPDAQSI